MDFVVINHILEEQPEVMTSAFTGAGGTRTIDGVTAPHWGEDYVGAGHSLSWIIAWNDGYIDYVQDKIPDEYTARLKVPIAHDRLGNMIQLRHKDNILTRYGHGQFGTVHKPDGTPWKVGDFVKRGTKLMFMGETGYSFGGHVHFEVLINGQPVNPRPFLVDPKYILGGVIMSYAVGQELYVNGPGYNSPTSDASRTRDYTGRPMYVLRYNPGALNPLILTSVKNSAVATGCWKESQIVGSSTQPVVEVSTPEVPKGTPEIDKNALIANLNNVISTCQKMLEVLK